MAETNEGPSLQGLAERLEDLERRNELMRQENAELREKVAALGSAKAPAGEVAARRALREPGKNREARTLPGTGEAVSRRAMLGKAGVAAAATVALSAGTLLSPRRAEAEDVTFDNVFAQSVTVENFAPSAAGVYGYSESGTGVVGDSTQGDGVFGRGADYGGRFQGGRAQLRLTPKGAVGRPRSGQHAKGEIYLDSAASVFVCTRGGTPGTWRKVSTTPA